jgi:hypothetical protein
MASLGYGPSSGVRDVFTSTAYAFLHSRHLGVGTSSVLAGRTRSMLTNSLLPGGALCICRTRRSLARRCVTNMSHLSLTCQAVRYVYVTPVVHMAGGVLCIFHTCRSHGMWFVMHVTPIVHMAGGVLRIRHTRHSHDPGGASRICYTRHSVKIDGPNR